MGKRVITESEINKMTAPGEIVVDSETLITPAALDAAFTRGLRVTYRKGETQGPPSRARLSSRERQILRQIASLTDGDYLLQIREGRLRVFRIGEDGVHPIVGP